MSRRSSVMTGSRSRGEGLALSALLLTLALAGNATAADGPTDGNALVDTPLHIVSESPFQFLRVGPLSTGASPLRKGEVVIASSETWTNIWIDQMPQLLLDFEALDSRLSWTAAATDSIQYGFEYEDRSIFGGRMDSIIQDFHRHIGNNLDGRQDYPRDSIHIRVEDPRTGTLLFDDGPSSEGAVSRRFSGTLSKTIDLWGGHLAGGASIQVPILSVDSRRSLDVGATGAYSRQFWRTLVTVSSGISRPGADRLGTIELRKVQWTTLTSVVQPVTHRFAAFLEYVECSGVADHGPLGRASHELTIGGRYALNRSMLLDIGVIENVIRFDSGPDFGLHFALTAKLGRK